MGIPLQKKGEGEVYIQYSEYSIGKTKAPVKDQRHEIPMIKISKLV